MDLVMRRRPRKPAWMRGYPTWLTVTLIRLDEQCSSYRQRGKRKLLAELTTRLRADGGRFDGDAVLYRYLFAVLDLFERESAARDDFAVGLDGIHELCRLARVALRGDLNDSELMRRWLTLDDLPGTVGWAVRVPGETTFLAAMLAQLPKEVPYAATLLVDQLAGVNLRIPIAALEAALLPPQAGANGM